MWVIFWCLILVAFAYYFQEKIALKLNPNLNMKSNHLTDGRISLVLSPTAQGHYYVGATINNVAVLLLLDTGATEVSIPAHLGKKLGLSAGESFPVKTANGMVNVTATQIDSLKIGEIELLNLSANLNPGMTDNTILLGMNALKQLELHQRNNTLTLTTY
ncbi:MAG: TIGR02281 family clan AA aspartic protease [Gammaproteobacteria bacterium]|nr:TIGR02281 family clan AA aspartic protease [Gammaproteobacteria bacterium]